MKIPALVTVLALACGGAIAGGSNAADHRDGKNHASAAASDQQSRRSGDGIVDKTKRTFQRMGEKIGKITRTGNPNEREHDQAMRHDRGHDQAMRNDTRRMGAAGSDTQDNSRRQRMDEAYANWQSQHKKQDR